MQTEIKILLAEDDDNLGFIISESLEMNGYVVNWQKSGADALEAFKSGSFQICLLDIMMPRMDGFTLAEYIRELDSNIPIMFLTARGLKEDKLKGFESGGDDYLVKPFSIEELLMRMKVFLKRSKRDDFSITGVIQLGNFCFNERERELVSQQATIRLTAKEAALLAMLLRFQGQVIAREKLLNEIWGNDDYFTGRSMDVYISKLRKYLKEDSSIEILNYHGTGFKLITTG